jgi:hypothetical protein
MGRRGASGHRHGGVSASVLYVRKLNNHRLKPVG